MRFSRVIAAAASVASVSAQAQGFNYGATNADGYTARTEASFQKLFTVAQNLVGTSGFTSARLYTTIQAGTTNDVTQAIPAAIATKTKLLLGLWASGPITEELTALKTAISQHGSSFTDLVIGISVGSEDLYRNSPTGIAAGSNIGSEPSTIVDYIGQVRTLISGTGLSGVPVGHVDTWTAWVNGSNSAVVDACDFIGMDAYPYFQNTETNGISDGSSLFDAALGVTQAAAGSKDVWITETGWPVTGKTENLAIPSAANAKTYWDDVGCPRFGKTNIFWYTLEDTDGGATPNPSFGIIDGNTLSTTPLFDLSCTNVTSSSSTSASSSTATATSSGSGAATTATASSIKSAASSLSTAASAGEVASSGGALSPSEGPGSGYGSGSNATATATESSGSTTNATGLSTTSKPTSTSGSSASSTSSITQASSNAGSVTSGSMVGVMGALLAALAAL